MNLRKFSSSDPGWARHPFTLMGRQGDTWTLATDREHLVAVKEQSNFPRCTGPLVRLLEVLYYPSLEPVELKVSKLLAFATAAEGSPVQVMGVVLDAEKLQKILEAAPSDLVSCWNASGQMNGEPCLGLELKGVWRAFLMGLADVRGDIPAFDLSSGFANEVDALADLI